MSELRGIEVVIFDVLGTLIDESGGLKKQIRAAVPDFDDETVQESVEAWQRYVALQQERIAQGQRAAHPPGCSGIRSFPLMLSVRTSRTLRSIGSPSRLRGARDDRVLMVAAHAWDLRGAQTAGMRTAFVQRPRADSPAEADRFDGEFEELAELRSALVPTV